MRDKGRECEGQGEGVIGTRKGSVRGRGFVFLFFACSFPKELWVEMAGNVEMKHLFCRTLSQPVQNYIQVGLQILIFQVMLCS